MGSVKMGIFETAFLVVPSATSLLQAGLFCIGAYIAAIATYRLFFHPLSKFPGPKLGALTFCYEFYHDVLPHTGQYMWKIKQLHEEYGPIIRINPIHLHISDPDYFDEIYAGVGRKRDRCSWFMAAPASGEQSWSLIQTMDHDHHRKRRQPLSTFFSKRNIQNLEKTLVRRKVLELCDSLAEARQSSAIVNLIVTMSALTMDVISEYCFGEDIDTLRDPALAEEWLEFFHNAAKTRAISRLWPWLWVKITTGPVAFTKLINPYFAIQESFFAILRRRIERTFDAKPKNDKGRRTVFHDLKASNLPPEELAIPRLVEESFIMVAAGTETTARTMAVACFHLISNNECLRKLQAELVEAMPNAGDDVSLTTLESMPYLFAVVHEALRVAHGVTGRQPRIATQEDLVYKEWIIPRGTPIMQSPYLHHTNPALFPDPFTFDPQRWLNNPGLTKSLLAFGRGSRMCLGMNLAMAEIYMTSAYVFRRFEFELHDTVASRDVEIARDSFIGMVDGKSKGIRVQVTADRSFES